MMIKNSQFFLLLLFALAFFANNPGCFSQPTDREYRLSRDAFSQGIRKGVLNDFSEAIEYFDRAISIDSTYSEAFLYRGLAYYELMQYEQSLNDLTRAYWLDARLEDQIHYYLGHVKAALHDFDGAIDHLTKAIQTEPDYAVYFERGRAFYCIWLYDTAIIDFNASLRLNPNMNEAILYRAKTNYYNNKLHEALQDFVAYNKKSQNDTIAHYYIDYIKQIKARQEELAKYPEITDAFDISDITPGTLTPTGTYTGTETISQADADEAENAELHLDGKIETEIIPDFKDTADIDIYEATVNDLLGDSLEIDDHEAVNDLTEMEQEFVHKDITLLDEGFYNVKLERVGPRGMGVQIVTLAQHEHILETVSSYQQEFGYPVYINISGNGSRRLYRIVIGSFTSRDEALVLRSTLRDHGYLDSFIIRYP